MRVKTVHLSQIFSDLGYYSLLHKGRKDSRVAIILNKETTTFSLQDMFRHSYVIFSCKCDFNGCKKLLQDNQFALSYSKLHQPNQFTPRITQVAPTLSN